MNSQAQTAAIVALVFAALAAFALYRWRQRRRACEVKRRVEEYLLARYGAVPPGVDVNCSNDPLWPVLVDFDHLRTGARHRLQFHCGPPASPLSLTSESVGP